MITKRFDSHHIKARQRPAPAPEESAVPETGEMDETETNDDEPPEGMSSTSTRPIFILDDLTCIGYLITKGMSGEVYRLWQKNSGKIILTKIHYQHDIF